jgi:hypothetical protein
MTHMLAALIQVTLIHLGSEDYAARERASAWLRGAPAAALVLMPFAADPEARKRCRDAAPTPPTWQRCVALYLVYGPEPDQADLWETDGWLHDEVFALALERGLTPGWSAREFREEPFWLQGQAFRERLRLIRTAARR